MICVVIKGPSFAEAYLQINDALQYADLVELRLDFFQWDYPELIKFRASFSIPMIMTLRSKQQGGGYPGSEENHLADIRLLAALNPEYLDLEHHTSPLFIDEISTQYPGIKVILSHHNFNETPSDLDALYRKMKKIPAAFYKIAVTAKSSNDALRLLCWAKKNQGDLIAISMGYDGQISRILGPIIGNPITYAALDEKQLTAPGQLTAKVLCERYHYHALNSDTRIYGLIGNPVTQSISDETHNDVFRKIGVNAVYVKMRVKEFELGEFLYLAHKLSFSGMSVTIPLKEAVIPYLDHVDHQAQKIGAVNTLCFDHGKISGFNTDCIGALNAIEAVFPVEGKQIVMIGAGGAAKAIAYEIHRRGGYVTILNRNLERAQTIAHAIGCKAKGIEDMEACAKAGYDVLINCTPDAMPISSEDILPSAVVMDITTKPRETTFLKYALEKNCTVIYGYRMFVGQAIGQFNLWFQDTEADFENILDQRVEEVLFQETIQ